MRHALIAYVVLGVPATAEEVRVLNWSEYTAPGVIEAFEAETGLDVVYDQYSGGEVVERRLLAGGSGYDVVVVSSEYLGRLIEAGAIQSLQPQNLRSWADLSPGLLERLAAFDPGNRHAAPYLWGTTGIGYDRDAILARDPDAPLDSWSLVFDPEIVAQFQDCGVSFVDAPEEVLTAALLYLGHEPDTRDPAHLEAAATLLRSVAPFVDHFDSEQIWDMAEGRICLAVGWSTDLLSAADIAGDGREIGYSVPEEGAVLWFDSFVVPSDAGNPEGARLFIEFMLRPENLAAATNHLLSPNASDAALPLVDEEVRTDPRVYPPADRMRFLVPVLGRSIEAKRAFTEVWNGIKLGF